MSRRYTKLSVTIQSKVSKVLHPVCGQSIKPFTEEYPANTRKIDGATNKNLNAHDLFNAFTADIIKTHVVFSR